MDFGHAAILIAALFGLGQLIKALFPKLSSRQFVLAHLALAVITVFLVAATVWGHEQVIGSHPLDKLNIASKIVVALFLAFTSTALNETLGAVRNIGENQPPDA